MHKTLRLSMILMLAFAVIASAQESLLLKSAKAELQRAYEEFRKEKTQAYFIGFSINESNSYRLSASCGKIERDEHNKSRILDIDLRVGDYNFDNTHIIRGAGFSFGRGSMDAMLPVEDDEAAIRASIWFTTDKVYKSAIERYEKAITNKAVKVAEEDSAADFSKEKADKYIGKIIENTFDIQQWRDKVRKLSDLFSSKGWIYESSVSISASVNNKYILNTEGSEIQMSEPYFRLMISLSTKAEDGMSLPLFKDYFSHSPNGFPDVSVIEKDIRAMIELASQLRKAPVLQNFSGPAILSGPASGVFFHEIFGHRVEGHRLKNPKEAQTFKNSINERILPEFIDVVFDPTINKYKGHEISGDYMYDDEGVKSRKVVTVKEGIFKDFLMSRRPVNNFFSSNGHGRKQAGYSVVSRQSNLLVEASETMTFEKLRRKLIDECKKQDKEYGLYFVEVAGGFTFTGTSIPNSFNVTPRVVYKIFADGRPDELVRGVDLIGTPITTFKNITAAADDVGIFNGVCGAESGGVPVSACSPSLLVSFIEAQKKGKSEAKLPILPCPIENQP